ncbi:MAG: hypothetical protein HY784_18420 [Chloroflexi bacterium]|nr:hypothetical protein [Chloroflexota bacterium]
MTTLLKTVTPEMPTLQIVPSRSLVLHEYMDMQRSGPLVQRLQVEAVLRNPPLVAPLNRAPADGHEQRYVVLDGANRTTALMQLGLRAVLAQIVQYDSPGVQLSTWNHVVCEMDPDELRRRIDATDGLRLEESTLLDARARLARRDILAFLAFADGGVLAAHPEPHGLPARTHLLNALVNTYKNSARLYRANTDRPEEVLDYYQAVTALVVFPRIEPVELQALARQGVLLPPGITRHVICGRALRLDYPLAELAAPTTIEEKNAALAAWIQQKLARKEIRYYEEPTFLFDE